MQDSFSHLCLEWKEITCLQHAEWWLDFGFEFPSFPGRLGSLKSRSILVQDWVKLGSHESENRGRCIHVCEDTLKHNCNNMHFSGYRLLPLSTDKSTLKWHPATPFQDIFEQRPSNCTASASMNNPGGRVQVMWESTLNCVSHKHNCGCFGFSTSSRRLDLKTSCWLPNVAILYYLYIIYTTGLYRMNSWPWYRN